MSLRTIKYLVVDNIVDDVPDAAPEIDAAVSSAYDVAAALTKTAGVPGGSEIYLQTFRPDGSARWQPVTAVAELPDVSVILAKVVRSRARPAAAHHPQQQHHPYQAAAAATAQGSSGGHGGLGHALGGLFKKLAVGGGSAGACSAGMGRMGGMGSGGGFGRRDSDAEDEYQRQLYEQQQLQELEDGVMRREDADNDNRHGWVDMDNNAGPEPEECRSDGDRDGDVDADGSRGDGWVDMDNSAETPEECEDHKSGSSSGDDIDSNGDDHDNDGDNNDDNDGDDNDCDNDYDDSNDD